MPKVRVSSSNDFPKCSLHISDEDGQTLLVMAAERRKWEVAKQLIESQADVNAKSISFFSADYSPICSLYMFAGGDQTPLVLAAENRRWDVVEQLIEYKADVSVKSMNIFLPITSISNAHHICDMLDENGQPPLMIAAQYMEWDIGKRLTDCQADVNVKGVNNL